MRRLPFPVLLLLLCILSHVSCTCHESVSTWLREAPGGALSFRSNVSELALNWSSLEFALSFCPSKVYQVEPWALRETYMKEKDFGSPAYWSQFERCTKLSPEMLRFHSLLRRGPQAPKGEENSFRHVVAKEYILRICICSPTDLAEPCSRACFSLNNSFCSDLLPNPGHSPISPWCEAGASTEGIVHFNLAEEHNCTSLKISGEVQTCTTVQDYDRVEVTFRPVSLDTEHCPPNPLSSQYQNSSLAQIPLVRSALGDNYSEYTGYFTHYFRGLRVDTKYCAQIEIKGNPYCQHEYILNDFEGPPSVCNKYLDVPLRLSGRACGGGERGGALWILDSGMMFQVTLIGVILGLILLFMALGVLILVRTKKLNYCLGTRTKRFKGWLFFLESPLPNDCPPSSPSPPPISVLRNEKMRMCKKVLFIYFNESKEILERNRCLKRWLQSLGLNILDLNDDEGFEEMGAYSESMIQDLISQRDTRVILVNSPLLWKTRDNPDEESDGREYGEGHSLLAEDNVLDLKVYAIDFIKTHFYSNYEKVSVINYASPQPQGLLSQTSSITPGRNVTLPEHFNALRTWIQSEDEEFPRISPATVSLQKEFDSIPV